MSYNHVRIAQAQIEAADDLLDVGWYTASIDYDEEADLHAWCRQGLGWYVVQHEGLSRRCSCFGCDEHESPVKDQHEWAEWETVQEVCAHLGHDPTPTSGDTWTLVRCGRCHKGLTDANVD